MIDLRTKTAEEHGISVDAFGGTVYVEINCESYTPHDKMNLLWDDEVDQFFYQFMQDADGIVIDRCDNVFDGIGYHLKYDHTSQIPDIIKAFNKRARVIMSCISVHHCDMCGRDDFTFINPDDFEYIWEKTDHCDCTDEDHIDYMLEKEEEDNDDEHSNEWQVLQDMSV